MISTKKIVLSSVVLFGSLTMAFSQSHSSEKSNVKSDTIIYVTPEQLEEGVRAVAQSIVDKRKASKADDRKDILSKENVQLLKYQMLLSALGMNVGVANSNNTESYRDNTNVNARLDRLENLLYKLLENRNTKDLGVPLQPNNHHSISKTTLVPKDSKSGSQEMNARIERVLDMLQSLKAENAQLKSQLNSNKTEKDNIVIYSSDTITLRDVVTADFKRQVFFVLGGDILTQDAKSILDNVVVVLNKYPTLDLDIIGYASEDGSKDFNLRLSGKRANKVFDYLVSKGVDSGRLLVQNGGVDSNSSILSTARRVDIVVHNN